MSNKKTVPEMPSDMSVDLVRQCVEHDLGRYVQSLSGSVGRLEAVDKLGSAIDEARAVRATLDALIARARAYREPEHDRDDSSEPAAPPKPERDPAKEPVVGDVWVSDWFANLVNYVDSETVSYNRDGSCFRVNFPDVSAAWTCIHRGDEDAR